jgi:voltage-gated potassium channel
MTKEKILFTRPLHTPERTILIRLGVVVFLIAMVVFFFWLERNGLKDTHDGVMSFHDILYFAMITVTTVGYGDIVPVSDSARLIDAFAVTPIRLFVWFIFLGTAYEFVFQKIVEDSRMSKLQKNLHDHVVLCGFGHSGMIAAEESVAKGTPPEKIVAIDNRRERVEMAAKLGYIGLLGDAAREEFLNKAALQAARSIIVSPGRDDTSILIILTARNLAPKTKILATISHEENIKLARIGGANIVVSPARMGGYLLANGSDAEHAADFLSDLMSAEGNIVLKERPAQTDDIGKTMAEVKQGVVVNVHNSQNNIPFSRRDDYVIQSGDTLLVICPTA